MFFLGQTHEISFLSFTENFSNVNQYFRNQLRFYV